MLLISQENTCVGDFCNFMKIRLKRKYFPVKFAKF